MAQVRMLSRPLGNATKAEKMHSLRPQRDLVVSTRLMALATIVRPFFVIAYVVCLVAYSVLAGLVYGVL